MTDDRDLVWHDDQSPPMCAPFFGERWNAPLIDDAAQVPTPVGEPCFHCTEPIAEGDRGLIRSVIRAVDGKMVAAPEPVHAECDLIGMIGHLVGVCACTGFDTSTRAAARLAWERGKLGRPLGWEPPSP